MGHIFSTFKVNMAAEQEVLIMSLLQREREALFQSSNGVTKLASFTRPRLTAGNIIVCRICKTTGNDRKW